MATFVVPLKYRSIIEEGQQTAPVKVVNIALNLGLQVFTEALGRVSGKLYRDDQSKSGWSISVNSNEVQTRQRFTVAHEIGHYVLHLDQLAEFVEDDTFYRSALSNRLEAQANSFAADLLMPWSLINKLSEEGVLTPSDLAVRLNVSEVAMSIRLGMPT